MQQTKTRKKRRFKAGRYRIELSRKAMVIWWPLKHPIFRFGTMFGIRQIELSRKGIRKQLLPF